MGFFSKFWGKKVSSAPPEGSPATLDGVGADGAPPFGSLTLEEPLERLGPEIQGPDEDALLSPDEAGLAAGSAEDFNPVDAAVEEERTFERAAALTLASSESSASSESLEIAAFSEAAEPSSTAEDLDAQDQGDGSAPQESQESQESPAESGQTPEGKSAASLNDIEALLLNDLDNLLGDDLLASAAPPHDGASASSSEADLAGGESRFVDGPSEADDPSRWPSPPEDGSDLAQLRRLLMDRELTQLSYFGKLVTDPGRQAHALSQVVTEALLLRTRRDDKLNTVLAPTVERIVTSSVRRNPDAFASQIFPVIGPAIRRSISETFVSMLQSFNSMLEKSLSFKGLMWRLEALRVRKPFSEIVFLHTLLYHVEEIYLIHAETGLVLQHLVSEGGESRDADLVAGMFTAIQEFVRDSFSGAGGENLENLRLGERSIFLRRTEMVYLACVVRGNPPATLPQDLQEALELMVVDCAEDLDAFKGHVEPFVKCRRYFEDFLQVRYQEKPKKLPLAVRLLPAAAVFAALFWLSATTYNHRRDLALAARQAAMAAELAQAQENSLLLDRRKVDRALELLRQEPGLVPARAALNSRSVWEVIILRDSLAKDPTAILVDEGGLNPARLTVINRPYVSLDEDIVEKRVETTIRPLSTVTMDFQGETGLLILRGSAPMGWILSVRERAMTIPGVLELDTTLLQDPRSMEMESLIASINGLIIHFPTNKAEPVPEDLPALNMAVNNLVALERLATEMQMSVNLVIFGLADATGQDRRNYELSEQRTKTVAAMLYARGCSIPIANYGLGSQFSAQSEEGGPLEDPESRRIELRVRLSQGGFRATEE
ncbi:MAG: hypothetical protein LBU12_04185 [Deltaproteobacteria bacterium]|jgi:OOP family OmpA-OmpF porin|nr:hypothetical protein [Deltaproteobacteria bacterium]